MDDIRRRLLRSSVELAGPVEPTVDDWATWRDIAAQERIIPLLFEVVDSTSQQQDSNLKPLVTQVQVALMGTMVRIEHDLLEIADLLSGAMFPYAVLKGMATAHLDYQRPELRQCSDVDLLVAPADMERAIEMFSTLGWSQAYALPRHHQAFTHAVTLRNGDRVEVDLHQSVAHRAPGRLVPTSELLSEIRPYSIAGQNLWALSDVDRLIHAALHTVLSREPYAHLSSTADVLVLTRAHRGLAEKVVARSDGWRIGHLVERAIRNSYGKIGEPLPEEWQRSFDLPRTRSSWLIDHAYLGPRRRPVSEELAHLTALPDWRERARYVSGYFATDPEYAAQHGRDGLWSQIRYLASRLRP